MPTRAHLPTFQRVFKRKYLFSASSYLASKAEPIRVIYISSYIPRKCGIATFTKDLTTAINDQNPEALAEIIAMNDMGEDYDYAWEVKLRINQDSPAGYLAAAAYINQSSADIVCLQHEFGLFGDNRGENILELVSHINKPLVTCYHTILPEPSKIELRIMKQIVKKSSVSIAMSEASSDMLVSLYGCPKQKAVVIQHGVPDFKFEETSGAKKLLQIGADPMIMVSGLISPGKGFEYVIDALPVIVKKFKSAKLYIVGQTHPGVIKGSGETYRNILHTRIKQLGLNEHVVHIDSFLELEELIKYYRAADIYITPHLDEQQPTSGTLAKALGAGKICIATPYFYAKEVLSGNTGILVPFANSKAITDGIIKVWTDKELRDKYRKNAYAKGKLMQWPRVAKQYMEVFAYVAR
jgi:glycosyltransferase involved in cell wall biosynthesis